MNFESTPIKYQPAYTWLWNSTVTKEGIKERIDEMYSLGIRAFYVLGESENFRPQSRRTHLSPEYLSPEYIDLVYYAYELAKERGMYTWLYNEGGFPSGDVCGKIRNEHPELAMKEIKKIEFELSARQAFYPSEDSISAFVLGKRINVGDVFDTSVTVTEYLSTDSADNIRTDNASLKNCELFLNMTHEKLLERFSDAMGTDITLMFDDEAYMGSWTVGLDKIFKEKYGYELYDYIQIIYGDKVPEREDEYRAKSDYLMLCGDLVRNNYFIPMKEWLNRNNMLSTGHLDNDHIATGIVKNRYGNSMQTLRAFDVPGVDVIWNQISYPDESNDFQGMKFFPRFASSAARQCGSSVAMSESLAVYGAHVDGELMRYVVNYQAVRGISLFNFMVMSYDRETPMLHQYRPNFVKENPGMDTLSQINNYTARLSHILSTSKADIKTALYFPARSICAGGAPGKRAEESFTRLGVMLEEQGVSFDIIDEDLVKAARVENGELIYGDIMYSSIHIPECDFEPNEVIQLISGIDGCDLSAVERESANLTSRKLLFENGDECYFIVNTGNERINESVRIKSKKTPYILSLEDGRIYTAEYTAESEKLCIEIDLLRGEGVMILTSDRPMKAIAPRNEVKLFEISDLRSFVSRRLSISAENGTVNSYYDSGELKSGLYEWDKNFSGEVTYIAKIPAIDACDCVLSLGRLCTSAKVYIDGKLIGVSTYPPYKVTFRSTGTESELKIVVSNTAANECTGSDYFEKNDPRDVGPYHEKMKIAEARKECGGLFGPISVSKLI